MRSTELIIATICLASAGSVRGIIVYGDQGRNLNAPTDAAENTAWQWEGQFGSFLGTAIAPQYFLTANHIGGYSTFTYGGQTYNIDTTYGSGGSAAVGGTDLRVWKVNGTFSTYAPLYGGQSGQPFGSEAGKPVFVVGRGLAKGNEISVASVRLEGGYGTNSVSPDLKVVDGVNESLTVPASTGTTARPGGSANAAKGWEWGTYDARQSWGENTADGTFVDPQFGPILYYDFSRDASPNEGVLASGDSGGGTFVDITGNGNWALAGINLAVDAIIRSTPNGALTAGALYDMGGFFVDDDSNPATPSTFIPDDEVDVPAISYTSSVSGNIASILQLIGQPSSLPAANVGIVPEPTSMLVFLGGLGLVRRSRRT